MRVVQGVLLCLAMLGWVPSAAQEGSPARATHDLATCLDAEDLPLCVLRFVDRGAAQPLAGVEPFRSAPAIAAAFDRAAPPPAPPTDAPEPPTPPTAAVQRASDAGDFEGALAALSRVEADEPRAFIGMYALHAARASGEAAAAAAFGRDVLEHAPADFRQRPDAMSAFAFSGDLAAVRALAETYDEAGRAAADPESAVAAVTAVAAWMALGESDRANAMLSAWVPLSLASDPGRTCGYFAWPRCARDTVNRMLSLTGRLEEGFADHGLRPETALRLDAEAGRGLQNLDAWLERAEQPWMVEQALEGCAIEGWRGVTAADAATCAHRLAERAVGAELTAREREDMFGLGGRADRPEGAIYVAAYAALQAGAQAARMGDAVATRTLLVSALAQWASAETVTWGEGGDAGLIDIGAALLEAEGRL